jgi:hypothetical protein
MAEAVESAPGGGLLGNLVFKFKADTKEFDEATKKSGKAYEDLKEKITKSNKEIEDKHKTVAKASKEIAENMKDAGAQAGFFGKALSILGKTIKVVVGLGFAAFIGSLTAGFLLLARSLGGIIPAFHLVIGVSTQFFAALAMLATRIPILSTALAGVVGILARYSTTAAVAAADTVAIGAQYTVLAGGLATLTALWVRFVTFMKASGIIAFFTGLWHVLVKLEAAMVASAGFGVLALIPSFRKLTVSLGITSLAVTGLSQLFTLFGASTAGAAAAAAGLTKVLFGLGFAFNAIIIAVGLYMRRVGRGMVQSTQEWIEVSAEAEKLTWGLGVALENFSRLTGDTSLNVEGLTKRIFMLAQQTGLSVFEMKGAVIQMLDLANITGLTGEQIDLLIGRMADFAAVTGEDFQSVIYGVDQALRGFPRVLQRMGLRVDKESANQTKFARTLGKTTDSMNKLEKATAFTAAIMEQTASFSGKALEGTFSTLQGAVQRFHAQIRNIHVELGKGSVLIWRVFYGILNRVATIMQKMPDWIFRMYGAFKALGGAAIFATGTLLSLSAALSVLILAFRAFNIALAETQLGEWARRLFGLETRVNSLFGLFRVFGKWIRTTFVAQVTAAAVSMRALYFNRMRLAAVGLTDAFATLSTKGFRPFIAQLGAGAVSFRRWGRELNASAPALFKFGKYLGVALPLLIFFGAGLARMIGDLAKHTDWSERWANVLEDINRKLKFWQDGNERTEYTLGVLGSRIRKITLDSEGFAELLDRIVAASAMVWSAIRALIIGLFNFIPLWLNKIYNEFRVWGRKVGILWQNWLRELFNFEKIDIDMDPLLRELEADLDQATAMFDSVSEDLDDAFDASAGYYLRMMGKITEEELQLYIKRKRDIAQIDEKEKEEMIKRAKKARGELFDEEWEEIERGELQMFSLQRRLHIRSIEDEVEHWRKRLEIRSRAVGAEFINDKTWLNIKNQLVRSEKELYEWNLKQAELQAKVSAGDDELARVRYLIDAYSKFADEQSRVLETTDAATKSMTQLTEVALPAAQAARVWGENFQSMMKTMESGAILTGKELDKAITTLEDATKYGGQLRFTFDVETLEEATAILKQQRKDIQLGALAFGMQNDEVIVAEVLLEDMRNVTERILEIEGELTTKRHEAAALQDTINLAIAREEVLVTRSQYLEEKKTKSLEEQSGFKEGINDWLFKETSQEREITATLAERLGIEESIASTSVDVVSLKREIKEEAKEKLDSEIQVLDTQRTYLVNLRAGKRLVSEGQTEAHETLVIATQQKDVQERLTQQIGEMIKHEAHLLEEYNAAKTSQEDESVVKERLLELQDKLNTKQREYVDLLDKQRKIRYSFMPEEEAIEQEIARLEDALGLMAGETLEITKETSIEVASMYRNLADTRIRQDEVAAANRIRLAQYEYDYVKEITERYLLEEEKRLEGVTDANKRRVISTLLTRERELEIARATVTKEQALYDADPSTEQRLRLATAIAHERYQINLKWVRAGVDAEERLKRDLAMAELSLIRDQTDEIARITGDATNAQYADAITAQMQFINAYESGLLSLEEAEQGLAGRLKEIWQGYWLARGDMEQAWRQGNFELWVEQVRSEEELAKLRYEENLELLQMYRDAYIEAHQSMLYQGTMLLMQGVDALNNAIASVINGLLTGSLELKDVLNSLRQALSRIISQWVADLITSQLRAFILHKLIVKAAVASAAAIAAAYAPAAFAVATATLGTAVLAAKAALTAGLAYTTALFSATGAATAGAATSAGGIGGSFGGGVGLTTGATGASFRAKGSVEEEETTVTVAEAGEAEAIIPVSRLKPIVKMLADMDPRMRGRPLSENIREVFGLEGRAAKLNQILTEGREEPKPRRATAIADLVDTSNIILKAATPLRPIVPRIEIPDLRPKVEAQYTTRKEVVGEAQYGTQVQVDWHQYGDIRTEADMDKIMDKLGTVIRETV